MAQLIVGEPAPELRLADQQGQNFDLAAFRGDRAVLLVFFPFAFSGVCTGELTEFRDRLGDVETDRCTLAAVSCDPVFSHRAMADRDALFFPLLSDFWPHGEVSRRFGVFDEELGCATRSSYLVDRHGIVAWSVHKSIGQPRSFDLHVDAVAQLV